ncbi:Taurine-transporting ATPase [Syntrophobotulus glycolicus DSM 8271]|uniref:ABC-type quaternary amine transporter n=2 Tax=Syntrophobotulus TaxID=51196 RepID=F0T2J2_SYNGF|nr:Taurine-transporting ATPase [Syntrophobotulus glycolicus DSM 8271]
MSTASMPKEHMPISAMMSNTKIQINHVYKKFPAKKGDVTALKDINIQVLDNEFVCVIGPSGCGKSTLLKIVAGLEELSGGEILVNDKVVTGPAADRGMVFQNYTLFPWKTVEENIAFGLRLKKMEKSAVADIVHKYLTVIGLEKFKKSYPKELSGGMKQRVAIARALANSPEVLLMDEPFGALDPYTKASMQELLRKIWQDEKTTILFVTHDIDEAVFLSETLYILSANPGEVQARVPIHLPHSRSIEIKDSTKFFRIRTNLSKVMQGKEDIEAIDEIYSF